METEIERRIRPAEPGDAAEIAALHLRAWQWAYAGLLPASYLDVLPTHLGERERLWQGWLAQPAPSVRTWVAAKDGRIVGFVTMGPSGDADATPSTGEVRAIYLDREVVGTGFGRALFRRAQDELRQQGFRDATLWVLETNARARRFYEAAGWQPDGATKTEQIGGTDVREVRYRGRLTAGTDGEDVEPGSPAPEVDPC